MKRYLRLYGLFLIKQFKVLMEYRVNFFIGASSTLVLQIGGLAVNYVVLSQIPSLNGWTLYEIALIYGLLTLAKSLNHMFADNLWTIGWDYIRSGGFDRFLVRPINPLFHLLADRFCHDGIGNFIVGAGLVWVASVGLGLQWTLLKALYLVVAVLAGGLIFVALNLLTATTAFWIMQSTAVTLAVFQTHQFAQYPLGIYTRSISILMTWVIPYGLASFYPAQFILGRDYGVMAWASLPVAAVLLIAAYRFWLFGLRHYGSTGS